MIFDEFRLWKISVERGGGQGLWTIETSAFLSLTNRLYSGDMIICFIILLIMLN